MLLPVAFMMVWTLPVFSVYLSQPLITWSTERLFTSFSPAFTNLFVMFTSAVAVTISKALKCRSSTVSDSSIGPKSTSFAAAFSFSRPFSAPLNCSFSIRRSTLAMVFLVFFSKFALSNRISTTRLSTS